MKISYVDVDFLSKYLLIYILFIYSFIYIKLRVLFYLIDYYNK